jgi:hypothetical protein
MNRTNFLNHTKIDYDFIKPGVLFSKFKVYKNEDPKQIVFA